MAAWCHLCQIPMLQEKGYLVTRPTQPGDVQRFVARIAFPRATLRHTFVFRPSFAFTLPHWTVLAAHLPFFPQLRDLKSISTHRFFRHYVQGDERTLLKDISREAGEADARVDERDEGLIAWRNRLLLLNQEEKAHAMRPVLPWHVPLHGRCA